LAAPTRPGRDGRPQRSVVVVHREYDLLTGVIVAVVAICVISATSPSAQPPSSWHSTPQVVVVGFSRSAGLILEPLHREVQRLCLRVPEVRASTLGDESVALGAPRLSLDEVDQRLLSTGLSAPVAPRRD
jgi:hypothetical protein